MDTEVSKKKSTTYKNLGDYGEFKNRARIEAWEVALDLMPSLKREWIVDLGCSYGSWVENYKELGFEKILGIDSNPEVFDRAKERCDQFLEGDSSRLKDTESIPFELIAANGVIVHILPDEDLERFFRDAADSLPKGGHFIFTGVNSRWWYSSGRKSSQNDYFKVRSISDYHTIAERAGLTIVNEIGTFIDPWAAEAFEHLALDEEMRAKGELFDAFSSVARVMRGHHLDPFTEVLFIATA